MTKTRNEAVLHWVARANQFIRGAYRSRATLPILDIESEGFEGPAYTSYKDLCAKWEQDTAAGISSLRNEANSFPGLPAEERELFDIRFDNLLLHHEPQVTWQPSEETVAHRDLKSRQKGAKLGRKPISKEADLIAVMAKAPVETVIEGTESGYVVRYTEHVIQVIADGSEAEAALDRAYEADQMGARAIWEALPLRYGPVCGTWVHPLHPEAPTAPSDNRQSVKTR